MIGQASVKNKGKMSRSLAAKAALATRVDAFGEDTTDFTLGAEHKAKLEARLQLLEEGNLRKLSGTGRVKSQFEKYHVKQEVAQYPAEADSTLPSTSAAASGKKRKHADAETPVKKVLIEEIKSEAAAEEPETPTGEKKKKKKKKAAEEAEEEAAAPVEAEEEATPAKKSKKKKAKAEAE